MKSGEGNKRFLLFAIKNSCKLLIIRVFFKITEKKGLQLWVPLDKGT
jgi:hypothetical protein